MVFEDFYLIMKSPVWKGMLTGGLLTLATSFSVNPGTAALAFQTVNFNVTKTPEINDSTFSFPQSGVTLNVSNPTGTAAGFTTLNSSPSGLCAFVAIGNTGSRCNYGPSGSAGNPGIGEKFNGFTLSFDKPGQLNSVLASLLSAVNSPSITFTAGTQTQTFSNFSVGDTLNFTTPFSLAANESVNVATAGSGVGPNGSGVFRINNVNYTEVPGPIGYLGAAAAFRYSRRIKSKLSK